MVKILNSLEVKHGSVEYSKSTPRKYTVGDLKKALALESSKTPTVTVRNTTTSILLASSTKTTAATKSKIKIRKLSHRSHYSGFDLIHSVQAKCKGKYFMDVQSTDIKINSDLFPLVYKITKERKISTSSTKTKII